MRFGFDMLPEDMDFTPLANGVRGRKRRAGDRYSKGLELCKRPAAQIKRRLRGTQPVQNNP